MDTNTASWIQVNVDEKKFCTIRLRSSMDLADCRTVLKKEYKLLSNANFSNTHNYHISQKDEHELTVRDALQTDNTIYMKTIEDLPTKTRKLETASKYLGLFFKLTLFAILISLVCSLFDKTMICQHRHSLPILEAFCSINDAIPPVSQLAERSVLLVDTLLTADTTAPMRFVQAKTSLIEIRMRIQHSDIDEKVRNELCGQISQLQQFVQQGAEKTTSLLVSFDSTLDKLRIYTKFVLEDFREVANQNSKMSIANKLAKSYEQYVSSISAQIGTILYNAQQAAMTLESITAKLETIQELNFQGQFISLTKLDELENDWFWNRLFGNSKLDIVKHKRNLEILNAFIEFVKNASKNVNDIIIKLQMFKNDAENLKQTEFLLEGASFLPPQRHVELLSTALQQLIKSKETFDIRMRRANQSP